MVRSLAEAETPQHGPEHRVGAVEVRPRAGRHGLDGRDRLRLACADDLAGLGEVRRAGRVDHDAPGRVRAIARARRSRCSGTSVSRSSAVRRQRASGRRRSAPSPVHGASTRTRSNDPSAPRPRASVVLGDLTVGRRRTRWRTRSARCGCSSFATSVAPRWAAKAPISAALPPGPAQRSSQRHRDRPAAVLGQGQSDQLGPSSCTPARPSRTAGISPGSPPSRMRGVGRDDPPGPPAARRARAARVGRRASREAARCRRRAGLEGRRPAPRASRKARRSRPGATYGWRSRVVRRRAPRDGLDPPVEVPLADRPQQRVREVDAACDRLAAHDIDGGRHSGVCGHAHAEQLVRTEPKGVEDRCVDRSEALARDMSITAS